LRPWWDSAPIRRRRASSIGYARSSSEPTGGSHARSAEARTPPGYSAGKSKIARSRAMNPNPFSDVAHFLLDPTWKTGVLWLLLLSSAAIAIYAWTHIESQRRARYLADWMCRLLIGCMWWQQTLWK